jgi:hypothetical protein
MLTDWQLEERRKYIGASDVPLVVLGELYDRTIKDLWEEKLGIKPPQDLSGNPHVMRGNTLEPVAGDAFRVQTDLSTVLIGIHTPGTPTVYTDDLIDDGDLPSPPHDWLFANLDGVVGHPPYNAALETKCPTGWKCASIRDFGIPDTYQLQCQAQMLCYGLERVYLNVFDPNLWASDIYELTPDEDMQKMILDKCATFWWCVENKTPPDVNEPPEIPNIGGQAVKIAEQTDLDLLIGNLKKTKQMQQVYKADQIEIEMQLLDLWPDLGGELAKKLVCDHGSLTLSASKKGKPVIRTTWKGE